MLRARGIGLMLCAGGLFLCTCTVSTDLAGLSGGDPAASSPTFPVGGLVAGLVGRGLVLRNNGANDLAVAANGTFAFPPLAAGSSYDVTVATQPSSPTQTCTVANGSGIVRAEVNNVAVSCSTVGQRIGGTVTGLLGSGLILQNNTGDDLNVTHDGPFTFATPMMTGASYNVTVKTQPSNPTQGCVVKNGNGNVRNDDISNVAVTCSSTFSESFDQVTAPALPSGWTSNSLQGSSSFTTETTTSDTPPNSVGVAEVPALVDLALTSPPVEVPPGVAPELSFRHSFSLYNTHDGAVLEIAIAGAPFQDILAAGGSFASGGYLAQAGALSSRMAWTGTSTGYITTKAKLPAEAAGKSVVLRWRIGMDGNHTGAGWHIDTVSVAW